MKDKDAEAMWMLGLCYEYGRGCGQDLERAEELYGQSCDGGNAIGKFLSENGKGYRGSGIMTAIGSVTDEMKKRIGEVMRVAPWTTLGLNGDTD